MRSRIHPANAQESSDLSGNVSKRLDGALVTSALLGHDMRLTAVREGKHKEHSLHYSGEAADMAYVDGSPVGNNPATLRFIIDNLARNPYVGSIGTEADVATNPILQAIAHQFGKLLFIDNGDGPHIHFSAGRG